MKQIITRFTTDAELAQKFGGYGSIDVAVCGGNVKFTAENTWLHDSMTVDVVDVVDALGRMTKGEAMSCWCVESKNKTMDGNTRTIHFQKKARSVYENTNVPADAIRSTMETYVSVHTGKCTIILSVRDVKEMLSIFSPIP